MYRYIVDQAITYTSEDFALFKESPFACWMERLTLENPDHGIPPDAGSLPPHDSMESQEDLAETLRGEGKNVVLVDWDKPEPERRTASVQAMRRGVDFIVNGQLALGTLSGSANLLMRTSGYSDLGEFLYVPCGTQRKTSLHSALRLCFLADLLHGLQGQLPPQMLILRGDADVLPLQTEDHIYHYRAVKQRFMDAMLAFRKHKMPDPAESSHFGRWSDCANEVIKQRLLKGVAQPDLEAADEAPEQYLRVQANTSLAYDLDNDHYAPRSARWRAGAPVSNSLAEQARRLTVPGYDVSSTDSAGVALENLAFIGSSIEPPNIGRRSAQNEPSSTLRDLRRSSDMKPKTSSSAPELEVVEPAAFSSALSTADATTAESCFAPKAPEQTNALSSAPVQMGQEYVVSPAFDRRASDAFPRTAPEPSPKLFFDDVEEDMTPILMKAHPLDSPGFQRPTASMIDMDGSQGQIPNATVAPRRAPPAPSLRGFDVAYDEHEPSFAGYSPEPRPVKSFDSSLHTSDELGFDDDQER